MIHVVVGPPCAGKSTFVKENRESGDVVVDFDAIAMALGADESHDAPKGIRQAAFAARDSAIAEILEKDLPGWVIHSRPSAVLIEKYENAGATFHLIDPGMETCLERAATDDRPERTPDVIRAWYDDPPEIPTNQAPKSRGFFHAQKEGPMKFKTVALEGVKAGEDDGLEEGQFIVYPSTFTKKPDAYGDIVRPGAFKKTIAQWKESGNVMPGLYGHRMDDPEFFVASAIDMGEDDHGWWVKGEFDLDSPKGRQVYKLVKGRRLNQLSFAYDVLDADVVTLDGGGKAYELRELDVFEFSFVPVGANSETSVVAVKQTVDALAGGVKAGRVLAQKHIDSLREAQAAIGAVIDAAEANDQEPKASVPAPIKPAEEPCGAKAGEESTPDASVEVALAVIEILEKG